MIKVLILGGGFGGVRCALDLDKKSKGEFEITLIDRNSFHFFTPAIYEVASAYGIKKDPFAVQLKKTVCIPFSDIFGSTNIRFIQAEIADVNLQKKKILTRGGYDLEYDYLVIASGSSYEAPFKEQRVVTATRAAHLRDYYDVLCKSKKVLIVGGGLVGVELAGEILDKYEDKEITIVHSGERLIARNNRKATSYAVDYLRRKGVKILYRQRMIDKKGRFCIMESGKKVEADLVFLCTGIKPNFEFMKGEFRKFLNNNGQIEVNEFLQLRGMDNVFAIGDITGIEEEKTAQNAERQAEVIVHNICNIERRIELCKYRAKVTPLVISLGKYNGILTKGDFVLTGRIPALMKAWIERWEMYKKRKVS